MDLTMCPVINDEAAIAGVVDSFNKLYIAINLINAAILLDHLQIQLLHLSSLLKTNMFISIYESGSTDGTARLLWIFKKKLKRERIPHSIVTNGSQRGRRLRIDLLADVRNAALNHFFRSATHFSKIVFINDVYFCASDVIKLVVRQHETQANMMCATDLVPTSGTESWFNHSNLSKGDLIFYDTWVARGVNGVPLRNVAPYAWNANYNVKSLPLSTFSQSMHAFNSLPAPLIKSSNETLYQVSCCWNGMVVMDSKPFYSGIRFRSSLPGECSECEVSLLCKDFHFWGFNRFAMDLTTKVTYSAETFKLAWRLPTSESTSHRPTVSWGAISDDYLCCGLDGPGNYPMSRCVVEQYSKTYRNSSCTWTSDIPCQIIQIANYEDYNTHIKLVWTWKVHYPACRYLLFTEDQVMVFLFKLKPRIAGILRFLHRHNMKDMFFQIASSAVMYELGGLYADIEITAGHFSCINDEYFFGRKNEEDISHVENGCNLSMFAVQKRSPILLNRLQRYISIVVAKTRVAGSDSRVRVSPD